MSSDLDTTRVIRSWLEEGVTALPDSVLDAVLDELPTTPQRRATWWPARRQPNMNMMLRFGLAATIVAAVALLGLNYFAPPNLGSGGLDDATPTSSPTAEPTAASIPNLRATSDLEAGTYRANAFIPIAVYVTVPDGWASNDWVIRGPDGAEGPGGMAIRFASVSNLFANPLERQDGLLDPAVGPTVQDLVDAMTSHPEWPTQPPVDITVDGYAGQHVRLTVPPDIDLPRDEFLLFRDEHGGDHWAYEPGQFVDFYIVDVDGERLVLELISYAGTPAADLAVRDAIVDDLRLEP